MSEEEKEPENEKAKVRVQMSRDLKDEMECALEFHRNSGDPSFADETLGKVMKRRGVEMIAAAKKYGDDYNKFRREFFGRKSKGSEVEGLDEEDAG